MPTVRRPAVAGTFYPANPVELTLIIDAALAAALQRRTPGPRPKVLVVPHAGYVYSGEVAASAYVQLQQSAGTADDAPAADTPVTRVVVLGPAHRVAVRSMALSSADAWRTPLGDVPLDESARELDFPGLITDDRAHAPEHSLEVQVPFLQRVLGDGWSLVPIVVGGASRNEVSEVLDALWGGPETLIVISTDLSHYHDDATARHLDAETAASIVARDADSIETDRACGAHPLRGMLDTARAQGLDVELLDLRTSADVSGDTDRVVGYGAFAMR